MILKIIKKIKKQYREIKIILAPHPLFNSIDKYKLSKIKKDTNKRDFIFLKPKGWKFNFKIRKNYTDKEVVFYVLSDMYHLPSNFFKIPEKPIILDLGCNIGLTIAHFKHLYPDSKIIGYEMNYDNFLLAKRNTEFYDDVKVINNAVWSSDSLVSYEKKSNYDSYSIINNKEIKNIDDLIEIQSISLKSIIKNNELTHVDYLKMDIEGAEIAILESDDLGWMDIVNSMNIEMHLDDNNRIEKFMQIIKNKGFKVWKDDRHWSSIFAVKE
jgi:FkbM family methyltransferase